MGCGRALTSLLFSFYWLLILLFQYLWVLTGLLCGQVKSTDVAETIFVGLLALVTWLCFTTGRPWGWRQEGGILVWFSSMLFGTCHSVQFEFVLYFFSHKTVGDPAVQNCFLPPFAFLSPYSVTPNGEKDAEQACSVNWATKQSQMLLHFLWVSFFSFLFWISAYLLGDVLLSSLPLLRNLLTLPSAWLFMLLPWPITNDDWSLCAYCCNSFLFQ